jgi:hypothetical protein
MMSEYPRRHPLVAGVADAHAVEVGHGEGEGHDMFLQLPVTIRVIKEDVFADEGHAIEGLAIIGEPSAMIVLNLVQSGIPRRNVCRFERRVEAVLCWPDPSRIPFCVLIP